MIDDTAFLCIDRIPPLQFATKAAEKAAEVRPENGSAGLEATVDVTRYWANGMVLRIRFLDGSAYLLKNVMAAAAVWTEHANIDFELAGGGDAEIIVTFEEEGNWSAVGTDAVVPDLYPAGAPTMCLSEVR